jgi:hypothetical protein
MQLHWSRADEDGAPFRGNPSHLTSEEYEQRVVRVGDPQAAFFDMTNEDSRKAYLDVVDGIVNKWFELVFIARFWKSEPPTHYVEWVEYFYEDGHRSPYMPGPEGPAYDSQKLHQLLFNSPPGLPGGPG